MSDLSEQRTTQIELLKEWGYSAEQLDETRIRIQGFGLDVTLPFEGQDPSWDYYTDEAEHRARMFSAEVYEQFNKADLMEAAKNLNLDVKAKATREELIEVLQSG